MIIKSIQVTNLGPFRDPVEIGPLDQDLHILAESNERGKTTLVKAAIRCLFDKHTCKDSVIRNLQPAGSDLPPKVTVCFEYDKKLYKISKRFIQQPTSHFYENHDGHWQRVAEGDLADKRVFDLLDSQQPGSGSSKPSHWGLMQYLWAMQGEPVTWPSWSRGAGEKIKSQLAKVEIDSIAESLAKAAQDTAGKHYTPTGQPRTGGSLKSEMDSLKNLEEELKDVRRQMEEVESKETRYQSLKPSIQKLEEQYQNAVTKAEELRKSASLAETVMGEIRNLEKSLQAAEKNLKDIQADRENLKNLEESIQSHHKDLLESQESGQAGLASKERLTDELKNLKALKLETQQSLRKINNELERTHSILGLRKKQLHLSSLEKLFNKANESYNSLQLSRKELDDLPSITSQKIQNLEELERSIRESEIRLQSTGLSIEIHPERAAEVCAEVDASPEQKLHFEDKDSKTLHASQTAILHLRDWGSISIRSGSEEISSLMETLDEEQKKLKSKLAELGISGIEKARETLFKRDALISTIREKETVLKNLLEEWDDLESLGRDLESCRRQCLQAERELILDETEIRRTESDFEALLSKNKEEVKIKNEELSTVDNQIHSAQKQFDKITTDYHLTQSKTARIQSEIHLAQQRIKDINSRYSHGLDNAIDEARSEFVTAEARYEEKKRELPEDHKMLSKRNCLAAAAEVEIKQLLEKSRREITLLEGELKALGGSGLYSKETQLIERIQVTNSKVQEFQTEGNAARLLYSAIQFRKNQATQTAVGPLQDRLSRQFSMLTGKKDRQVYLGNQLQIVGIGRESAIIPFDSLSQGAKEQLVLSLRLAVAEELSSNGNSPQCLILDDVLVNSDRERRERIMDALSAAKANFQILLLTCHPEWYRGLGKPVQIASSASD